LSPDKIKAWAGEVRKNTNGGFQLNSWIPDPDPGRNAEQETQLRELPAQWGPAVPKEIADKPMHDFEEQVEAMIEAGPSMISSIMGLYPPEMIAKMKSRNIAWLAQVSTVTEARAAEEAGADVIVAQGYEAGGHRSTFDQVAAEHTGVGLFSLVPAVVDAVNVPVVAAGGIADGRGIAAALRLGASAVQIGTGFLRCPEAKIPRAWADALGTALPENAVLSRVFTGRPHRTLVNDYLKAATAPGAPEPARYPYQSRFARGMRLEATKEDDFSRLASYAGQSAGLARAIPAEELFSQLWQEATALLH
jgi:nitronate monooxygenase